MEMELLDGRRAFKGLLTLMVALLYVNAVSGISGRAWFWDANAQKGMTTTAFSWLKANFLGIVWPDPKIHERGFLLLWLDDHLERHRPLAVAPHVWPAQQGRRV